MAIATLTRMDETSRVIAEDGFDADPSPDSHVLAEIAGLPLAEVERRREAGHRPYLARVNDVPAAYGWVATRRASIGELGLEIELPAGNRYLWDFATLPTFRGRGIYPRLLREIVRIEAEQAERFWIIYAPENLPSGVGIQRAGFRRVAELSFDVHGRVALGSPGDHALARMAHDLLDLPIATEDLDPCWACGGCGCDDGHGACCCVIAPARQ